MSQGQQYEYKVVGMKIGGSLEDKLNTLGEDGWQLKEQIELGGTSVQYIFERPVDHGE